MSEKILQQPAVNKLLGLEIMRFFSALSILIWHYQHFAPNNFIKEQQPLYPYLSIFYEHGGFGVYVFYCISGFIFFWKYRETISNRVVGGKEFFILRFARLYPLHLLTLLLVAVLQLIYFNINNNYFIVHENDSYHFILQLFFASDWGFQKGASFNAPIWSISIEILVYFLFFLILRYLSKSILINIILIILCIFAKTYDIPLTNRGGVASPIVSCIVLFYMGGLSAILFRIFEKKKYKFFLDIILGFALILVSVIIWQFEIYKIDNFDKIFVFFYAPALLYIASQNIRVKSSLQKSIEMAGNLTYSSYLIHFPIQIIIVTFFSLTNIQIPFYNVFFFLSYILLTLIISHVSYYYYEAPARKLIRLKFSSQT